MLDFITRKNRKLKFDILNLIFSFRVEKLCRVCCFSNLRRPIKDQAPKSQDAWAKGGEKEKKTAHYSARQVPERAVWYEIDKC